jgi:hypothetical protein
MWVLTQSGDNSLKHSTFSRATSHSKPFINLVLVWSSNESWENLMESLACQLSCNSCSRSIKQWKLRKF